MFGPGLTDARLLFRIGNGHQSPVFLPRFCTQAPTAFSAGEESGEPEAVEAVPSTPQTQPSVREDRGSQASGRSAAAAGGDAPLDLAHKKHPHRTGVPRSMRNCPPWDPTVRLCIGTCGGPGGGRVLSYERSTPVVPPLDKSGHLCTFRPERSYFRPVRISLGGLILGEEEDGGPGVGGVGTKWSAPIGSHHKAHSYFVPISSWF